MRNYTQPSRDERHDITTLRCLGAGFREIGRLLGRSPSTILREVRRNRYETDGSHKARHAHGVYRGRRRRASILTLVDRKTGFLLVGKLRARTAEETNASLRGLIERHPSRFRTITADNGCEIHGYAKVEESHSLRFYLAPPYHSRERGTNENTNGLIRQYLPKGCCMENLTQAQCDRIADRLNDRPRKPHNFYTPAEKFLT